MPTVPEPTATIDHGLTAEALFALGDLPPCESIDGRIRPLFPTGALHGKTELQLGRIVADFVDSRGLGWVLVGEVGRSIRSDARSRGDPNGVEHTSPGQRPGLVV